MSTWSQTVNPQDLRNVMSRLYQGGKNPDPILQQIIDLSIKPKSARHEWGNKKIKNHRSSLQSGIDNAVTTIPLATGTGAGLNILNSNVGAGFVCTIKIDFELMLVTAGEGTDSLTVTRGYKGTTAASHSASATVMVMNYYLENADFSKNFFQGGTTEYNMTQTFREDLSLSGSMQAFTGLDGDNTMAKQLMEKDWQLTDQIAKAVYLGVRSGSTNNADRTMGGIQSFATTNTGAVTLDAAFIESSVITPLIDNGADPNNLTLAVPPNLYSKLTALKTALVTGGGMDNSEGIIMRDYNTYDYAGTPLRLFRTLHIPNGHVCAFDRSRVKLIAAPGRSYYEEALGKTGDNDKVMLLSEMTLEVMNGPEACLWFSAVT